MLWEEVLPESGPRGMVLSRAKAAGTILRGSAVFHVRRQNIAAAPFSVWFPRSGAAEHHGGVLAAESDTVGDGVFDVHFAADIGDVVEVAVLVGLIDVDGGR